MKYDVKRIALMFIGGALLSGSVSAMEQSFGECPIIDVETLNASQSQGGVIRADGKKWIVEWLDENPWEKPFTDVGRTNDVDPMKQIGSYGWKAPIDRDPLQRKRVGIWCDNYYAFTDFSLDNVKNQNLVEEEKLGERIKRKNPKAYEKLMILREKHEKLLSNIDVSSMDALANLEEQIDKIEKKYRIYDKGYKAFVLKSVDYKTLPKPDIRETIKSPPVKAKQPQDKLGLVPMPLRNQPPTVASTRPTSQVPTRPTKPAMTTASLTPPMKQEKPMASLTPPMKQEKPMVSLTPPMKQEKPMISLAHPTKNVVKAPLPQGEKSNVGEYSSTKTAPKEKEVLREIKIGFLISTPDVYSVSTPYVLKINGIKWGELPSGTYAPNQRIDLKPLSLQNEMNLRFVLHRGEDQMECKLTSTEQSGVKVQSFRVEVKSEGGQASCDVVFR